jgi:hypothetical protein
MFTRPYNHREHFGFIGLTHLQVNKDRMNEKLYCICSNPESDLPKRIAGDDLPSSLIVDDRRDSVTVGHVRRNERFEEHLASSQGEDIDPLFELTLRCCKKQFRSESDRDRKGINAARGCHCEQVVTLECVHLELTLAFHDHPTGGVQKEKVYDAALRSVRYRLDLSRCEIMHSEILRFLFHEEAQLVAVDQFNLSVSNRRDADRPFFPGVCEGDRDCQTIRFVHNQTAILASF